MNGLGKKSVFLTPSEKKHAGLKNINAMFIVPGDQKVVLSTQKSGFQRAHVDVVSTAVSQMFFLAYFCRPFKINVIIEYVNHSKYT